VCHVLLLTGVDLGLSPIEGGGVEKDEREGSGRGSGSGRGFSECWRDFVWVLRALPWARGLGAGEGISYKTREHISNKKNSPGRNGYPSANFDGAVP
jgi:hypothetical protein